MAFLVCSVVHHYQPITDIFHGLRTENPLTLGMGNGRLILTMKLETLPFEFHGI